MIHIRLYGFDACDFQYAKSNISMVHHFMDPPVMLTLLLTIAYPVNPNLPVCCLHDKMFLKIFTIDMKTTKIFFLMTERPLETASPAPSCLCIKSDHSMDYPIVTFTDGDIRCVCINVWYHIVKFHI